MNQATAEKPLDEIKQGTSQMQQDSASNPLPTTGNTPETPTPRDNPQTGPQTGKPGLHLEMGVRKTPARPVRQKTSPTLI